MESERKKMDTTKLKSLAFQQLGISYGFGSKWDINDPNPIGPCDCSGAIRWLYNQAIGLLLPDGSEVQREACRPLAASEVEPFRAIGFFLNHNGVSSHVFCLYDDSTIWNQEGAPWDKCILRPRQRFEAWPSFSGWMTPKALDTLWTD